MSFICPSGRFGVTSCPQQRKFCRLRFSFFVDNFSARAPYRIAVAMLALRGARHEPRRPVGLARFCLGAWLKGL